MINPCPNPALAVVLVFPDDAMRRFPSETGAYRHLSIVITEPRFIPEPICIRFGANIRQTGRELS